MAEHVSSTPASKVAQKPAPAFPAPTKPNKIKTRPEHFPNGGVDPAAYALELVGNCLEPKFYHGDMAICSPAASIGRGDFVALWFVEAGKMPMLKRMVMLPDVPIGTLQHPQSEIGHAVLVEMLNPSRLIAIRISELRAMHRVVGRYRKEEIAAARCQDEHGGRA